VRTETTIPTSSPAAASRGRWKRAIRSVVLVDRELAQSGSPALKAVHHTMNLSMRGALLTLGVIWFALTALFVIDLVM
jgi:hypothetical protein